VNATELFPPPWFAAGVVTPESAADFARFAAGAPARPPRHWLWAAFRDRSEERDALTADECRAAFALGGAEPDRNLGTAMMCHVLYQRLCPADVRDAARRGDRAPVRHTAERFGPARRA
jgi:hypothetical protein